MTPMLAVERAEDDTLVAVRSMSAMTLPDGRRIGNPAAGQVWGEYRLAPVVRHDPGPPHGHALRSDGPAVRQPDGSYRIDVVYTDPDVDGLRAARLAELAAYRYGIETGGIVVAGAAIRTDRESQGLIAGAFNAVQQDPAKTIDWKAADGTWTQLGAAQIAAIAVAVADHVQACFSQERVHAEALAQLDTVAALVAYDISVGWPPSGPGGGP